MAAVPACMEADLQAFLDYLESLAEQGPISQARLDAVLDQAERWHTRYDLPDPTPPAVERKLNALGDHIETLRKQREIDRNRNIEPGQDGIGPLVGGHF
jgi:hypothetical protein